MRSTNSSRFLNSALQLCALGVAITIALLTLAAPAVAETNHVRYVDLEATGGDNGTTWQDAYDDLQEALDEAENYPSVTEIWVRGKTTTGLSYVPTSQTDPTDPRSATFSMIDGVSIYGGFEGNELNREDRDPTVFITILEGRFGLGPADRVYHVVTATAISSSSTSLDGFTIQHGLADELLNPDRNSGAGMLIRNL